jgi:hypothetical protein
MLVLNCMLLLLSITIKVRKCRDILLFSGLHKVAISRNGHEYHGDSVLPFPIELRGVDLPVNRKT